MSIRIKPGESLEWSVVDDSNDLTGVTIESALRVGDFYYPLTVTPVDLSVGSYILSATSTEQFPEGRLNCDIKYTAAGLVTPTQTFTIYVDKQVTK